MLQCQIALLRLSRYFEAVLQNNAAIMSVVGYFIPVCSCHFVVAVWSTKSC